jgi:hypothetical protein
MGDRRRGGAALLAVQTPTGPARRRERMLALSAGPFHAGAARPVLAEEPPPPVTPPQRDDRAWKAGIPLKWGQGNIAWTTIGTVLHSCSAASRARGSSASRPAAQPADTADQIKHKVDRIQPIT